MVDVLRVPVLTGHKTARERFAGADKTWTCEGMMGDGKALQMGTSHELGQNFSVPFDITFSNASGSLEHVWQTSWGASTRLIGALVMAHGDDFGLRLPPAVAPAQVVVMVIKDDAAVGEAAASLCAELRAAGHRVRLDDRTDTSFGRRSVDWELKGVPVRVEVGPRDLAEGNITLVVRHTREKKSVPLAGVGAEVDAALALADRDLLAEATAFREAKTADAGTFEEAVEAGSVGFARVRVGALGSDGEDRLAQHALTIRCLQRPDGSLAGPGDPEQDLFAIVGRSY
jgi:prolyl-tRNA synthetase